MKNKGISLIVLVITIVVVIIIAAAVILSLGNNNPIQTSRAAATLQTKDSVESGVLLYTSNIKAKTLGERSTEEILITDDAYKVVGNGTKTIVRSGISESLYELDKTLVKDKLGVDLKNEQNSSWYVDKNGKVYLVYDNELNIPSYLKDGDNVISGLSGTVTYNGAKSYKVGDRITMTVDGNEETFFAIKDSDVGDSEVVMITKENVDSTTLLQSATASNIKFCDNPYWQKGFVCTSDPNDSLTMNCVDSQDPKDIYLTSDGLNVDIGNIKETDNKYVLYVAQEYGKKLNGKGRLILSSEVEQLKKTNLDLVYARRRLCFK